MTPSQALAAPAGQGSGRVLTPEQLARYIAANVRAARAYADISQKTLSQRMTVLGFKWAYQTVGKVENGNRPLLATEIFALAQCLDTTTAALMTLPPLSSGSGGG